LGAPAEVHGKVHAEGGRRGVRCIAALALPRWRPHSALGLRVFRSIFRAPWQAVGCLLKGVLSAISGCLVRKGRGAAGPGSGISDRRSQISEAALAME